MATPPVNAWPRIEVRVPPQLLAAIQSRAADCGLPVGDVLRELCEVGLARFRCQHRAVPAAAPTEAPADDEDDES